MIDPNIPVIFLSLFEHNANNLPWRETGAHIEYILLQENGDFNYEELEKKLKMYINSKVKVGAFSAGSNITGIYADVDRISIICHLYGAYAIFDYAAVGPYLPIYMNGMSPIFNKDSFKEEHE